MQLLLMRNDALAMAGYSVAAPRHPEDAPALVRQGRFDAVVIGHSIPRALRTRLMKEIREIAPQIPIVFVYAAPMEDDGSGADVSVDITDGPFSLIRVLDHQLNRNAA